MTLHTLLARQLRRFGGTEGPPAKWQDFLAQVNEAYDAFDRDRVRTERSLELMSKELNERYEALQADVQERIRVEEALRLSESRLRSEMEDRQRMEVELRHSQKLEAVGQLAAGIAHEINTPVQYVSDSVRFLKDAVVDYRKLLEDYRRQLATLSKASDTEAIRAKLLRAEEDADLEYLDEQVPRAFDRVTDGTARVASIVRAVKEFAHPDQREKAHADVNAALRSTLTVARNEYKYVAEPEILLGEIPAVCCHIGDLNQVFLNLIVNAAHAIADARKQDDGTLGRIGISTACDGDDVVVSISDSGGGIPEHIRERIFDPFFTTKEVGRGTGQGLAIARAIVVEKHGGSLSFDTEIGRGTTFHVRIPIDPDRPKEIAA